MFNLPTAKRFRKRTRIQNLTMQLNGAKHIIQALARTANVHHQGLTAIRECYLEAPLEDAEPDCIVEREYVWNGDKPAPEMILDLAEQVETIFKEAGLDPSVLEKKQAAQTGSDQPVNQIPSPAKV